MIKCSIILCCCCYCMVVFVENAMGESCRVAEKTGSELRRPRQSGFQHRGHTRRLHDELHRLTSVIMSRLYAGGHGALVSERPRTRLSGRLLRATFHPKHLRSTSHLYTTAPTKHVLDVELSPMPVRLHGTIHQTGIRMSVKLFSGICQRCSSLGI